MLLTMQCMLSAHVTLFFPPVADDLQAKESSFYLYHSSQGHYTNVSLVSPHSPLLHICC